MMHATQFYYLTNIVSVCVVLSLSSALFSCRVQQLLQQPSLCLQGSPHTISSSPAKVETHASIWPDREGTLRSWFFCFFSPYPFNVLAGQLLQVVRAPNGTQYIIQPQQQILLQQQMQPAGVQAPVIQQVCHVPNAQKGSAVKVRL